MNNDAGRLNLDQTANYEVRVQGRLSGDLLDWSDCLSVEIETTTGSPSITTFIGPVKDQSALHGLLKRIRDLGLPILVVRRIENDELQKPEKQP
jgi:hypothetical protein